jgi:oligopeptide/dipeptide ABC transporter ATP-binding protein
MNDWLLSVNDLSVRFNLIEGSITVVDRLSFEVGHSEIMGILGESGCGKSVSALSVMRLIQNPGRITDGSIMFNGNNLLKLTDPEMNRVRGNDIAMIFQDPMTSLNPVFKIGKQISEAICLHQGVCHKDAVEKTVELLRDVSIPLPEKRFHQYPHQLSGGLRQRVMITMALSSNPKLLIADEPTTALDVTIQAQILDLIRDMQSRNGMSIILITHDLGVIAEMAQRVIVMYAGRIVESAPVESIFDDPLHPYTKGLLSSVPSIKQRKDTLPVINGIVPHPSSFPPGCRFHPRCRQSMAICYQKAPELLTVDGSRKVRCWLYQGNRND